MAPIQEMQTAMVNRSIRTIKAELEFLCDASIITPQTLSDLLSRIPEQTALHAPLSNSYFQPPAASPQPPPPSYNSPPPQAQWPPLCQATALYAYTSTDAGDLELQPNDQVAVIEYMNAEWWKGRSSRTGQEGIFPRSYVKVNEEKDVQPSSSTNYGNAPLQVSQMGDGSGAAPGRGQEMGKKFGKKLGNAAVFGAGATLGSKIVNGIF
ncbi:hypothetical protein M433DRAFT_67281 [Acidomyces richmondensis BFW]|nr:hypothetical protein M433DRAFT_67281 [Acidomyces richmondensis BFW]